MPPCRWHCARHLRAPSAGATSAARRVTTAQRREMRLAFIQWFAIGLGIASATLFVRPPFRAPTSIRGMMAEPFWPNADVGAERFQVKAETVGGLILLVLSTLLQGVVASSAPAIGDFAGATVEEVVSASIATGLVWGLIEGVVSDLAWYKKLALDREQRERARRSIGSET